MTQVYFSNRPAPTPTPFSAKDFVETQNAAYGHDQTVTANNLFAKHMDANGNLNENGYYTDAARAGLSREAMGQPIDWYAKNKAADLNTAITNESLRQLGYNPNAGGRNTAQVGAPAPISTTVSTQTSQPISNVPPVVGALGTGNDYTTPQVQTTEPMLPYDTSASKQSAWDKFKASFNKPQGLPSLSEIMAPKLPSPDQVVMPSDGMVAPIAPVDPYTAQDSAGQSDIQGNLQVLAQAQAQAPMATLPPLDQAQEYTNVPDNRTARQKVEDSYNAPVASTGVELGTSAPDISADIFKFNVEDDGTNQYRQYKTALASQLKSSGFGSSAEYLQTIYAKTLKNNMPAKPSPLIQSQKDGLAKWAEAQSKYNAELTNAHGKAEGEVLKAKDDLRNFAKEYGVSTVEQRKSEVPDGILRDPANRLDYSSLQANEKLISSTRKDLASAPSITDMMMIAPSVYRAASTANNPKAQLSEGNLMEQAQRAMPELGTNLIRSLATVIIKKLAGEKIDVSKELSGIADVYTPEQFRSRLSRILDEASEVTAVQKKNLIVQREKTQSELAEEEANAKAEADRKAKEAEKAKKPETVSDKLQKKFEDSKKSKKPIASKYKEGETKTNKDGDKMVYRSGKWQAQ